MTLCGDLYGQLYLSVIISFSYINRDDYNNWQVYMKCFEIKIVKILKNKQTKKDGSASIHINIIYNGLKVKTTQMSINCLIDKQNI